MKRTLFLIAFFALLTSSCCNNKQQNEKEEQPEVAKIEVVNKGNVDFSSWFLDKTMRLDYFHTGKFDAEFFAKDRVVSDGIWPGSKTQLVDNLEFGPYFFEVIDMETSQLLYSRGFASIFGEWQSIPEAETQWGTFHESLRFPWPKKSVKVIVSKRGDDNTFFQIWDTEIDPLSRQVNPADRNSGLTAHKIVSNGSPSEKLDIVILGDGYTKEEMAKFKADVERLSKSLLSVEPYNSRKSDINVWAVETPAEETGVNNPHKGVFRRNPLSASYSAFDSERYVLAYDNSTIRDVASSVPYDFMVILLNERTYGGGGIYNLYTTVAADNLFADYLMIHEMGHHMGALADEYYTSPIEYEAHKITIEPVERNITALLDKDNLKWKNLVDENTPIPTPWNKVEFDKFGYQIQHERDSLRAAKVPESVMEELFLRQKRGEEEFIAKEKYAAAVGAFEGAGYQATGLYRSQLNCIMYTRHTEFCKVCQQTLSDVIDQYSK